MTFWIIAALVTLIALITLYYASRAIGVNASGADNDAPHTSHFRAQLVEIERAADVGRMSAPEVEAAKAELARELIRQKSEHTDAAEASRMSALIKPFAAILVVAIAFGTYIFVGQPNMPATPLATRTVEISANTGLDDAIAKVEAQLELTPDDVRGWMVLAPIYMRAERFEKAESAFRRILEIGPITADAETNLAEALMMLADGVATGEPMQLLRSAAARDPSHARSRFYLAGEATRAKNYINAILAWGELLALSTGDEPWLQVARQGLATAEAGLRGDPPPQATAPDNSVSISEEQQKTIRAMVEGISERLNTDGGSLEEWTRLVRSRLVLGEKAAAQLAYDNAKIAYPDEAARAELEALAAGAGLE